MTKKISLFNLFLLLLIFGILASIDTVVDAFYHYHFKTAILPGNPQADFNLMFDRPRLQSDKQFLWGIWFFVLVLQMVNIYQDFKLWRIKQSAKASRQEMFSVFFSRMICLMLILVALPLNLVVFDKSYSAGVSFADKMVLGFFIGVMINSVALIPYLAQKNIAGFFRLKEILLFNLAMFATLVILSLLGISPYAAPAISAAISALPFAGRIVASWKHVEQFFDIKDKRIYEMF